MLLLLLLLFLLLSLLISLSFKSVTCCWNGDTSLRGNLAKSELILTLIRCKDFTNDFGDGGFSAYFPDETMDGGGKVSALLTGDDINLTTATNSGEADRLIGVFETNSGSPVVITDATNGLEMQLTVTDIGYGIEFSSGEPTDFGSMPFKPVFATF